MVRDRRCGKRLFLAIREPSMILTSQLPELDDIRHWTLPSAGAHGLDIDYSTHLLYVACDTPELEEMDALSGRVLTTWPLPGVPDATFFNAMSVEPRPLLLSLRATFAPRRSLWRLLPSLLFA
jgi:hypothetical protein